MIHNYTQAVVSISIHVPRKGNDEDLGNYRTHLERFQSTFPAKGTTENHQAYEQYMKISIHVPRKGNDSIHQLRPVPPLDFNPRSPQRERQQFLPILSLCFYATITCFHFFSPFSLPKFIIVVFKLYIFVHFFRCESTAFFMCNYGSHLQN